MTVSEWLTGLSGLSEEAILLSKSVFGVYFADFALLDFLISETGRQVLHQYALEKGVPLTESLSLAATATGHASTKDSRDAGVQCEKEVARPCNKEDVSAVAAPMKNGSSARAASSGEPKESSSAATPQKTAKPQRMSFADRQRELEATSGHYFAGQAARKASAATAGPQAVAGGGLKATKSPSKSDASYPEQKQVESSAAARKPPAPPPLMADADPPPPRAPAQDFQKEPSGQTFVGVLKSFSEESGYGFFLVDGVDKDVFVRRVDLPHECPVVVGSVARLSLSWSIKGQPQASNAVWVNEPAPKASKAPKAVAGSAPAEAPPELVSQERFQGTLRSTGDGYGFITCERAKQEYGRDVFVPRTICPSDDLWKVDTPVSFHIALNAKGHPQARDVEWQQLGTSASEADPGPGEAATLGTPVGSTSSHVMRW